MQLGMDASLRGTRLRGTPEPRLRRARAGIGRSVAVAEPDRERMRLPTPFDPYEKKRRHSWLCDWDPENWNPVMMLPAEDREKYGWETLEDLKGPGSELLTDEYFTEKLDSGEMKIPWIEHTQILYGMYGGPPVGKREPAPPTPKPKFGHMSEMDACAYQYYMERLEVEREEYEERQRKVGRTYYPDVNMDKDTRIMYQKEVNGHTGPQDEDVIRALTDVPESVSKLSFKVEDPRFRVNQLNLTAPKHSLQNWLEERGKWVDKLPHEIGDDPSSGCLVEVKGQLWDPTVVASAPWVLPYNDDPYVVDEEDEEVVAEDETASFAGLKAPVMQAEELAELESYGRAYKRSIGVDENADENADPTAEVEYQSDGDDDIVGVFDEFFDDISEEEQQR
mmetsp:Transcript_29071/g.94917  ORF Transcript_29071/g.94917 Transcript_29071/m.94917 type:complete len:393 (+) Transcript_29071:82-1260(+)